MFNYFPIQSTLIFGVSGKDARRYLNARLSNNIKNLTPGSWLNAAALTAQGRIQGIYRVLCLEADSFLLACDGGEKDVVLAALKKFIVADRVEVQDLGAEYGLWHACATEPGSLADTLKFNTQLSSGTWLAYQHGYVVQTKRSAAAGVEFILPPAAWCGVETLLKNSSATELNPTQVEFLRISAGIPSFPQDLNEDCILLEAGIEDYASFTKGCYVGQEVVEKIDSHGRPPRRLAKLEASSSEMVSPGTVIIDADGRALGKITSYALDQTGKRALALAFIRNQEKLVESVKVGETVFRVC